MEQNELEQPEEEQSFGCETNIRPTEEVIRSKTSNDTYVLKNGGDLPGVFIRKTRKEGDKEQVSDEYICNPVRVLALVRDTHQNGYGLLIDFVDMDGNHRETPDFNCV